MCKMEKREIIMGIFILGLFVFLGIASAAFTYEGHKIEKSYRAGEDIRGILNLSLKDQNAKSVFTSSFGNSFGNISLIGLLRKNGFEDGEEYECNSMNCSDSYKTENSFNELEIEGGEIIGLKIGGDRISEISILEFKAESGVSESCQDPLEIDILNDGKNIVNTQAYKDVSCGANKYGCFDTKLSQYASVVIEDSEICETISIDKSPAYRIGARITNSSDGRGALKMTMYNSEGESVSCELPEPSQSEGEIDCIVKALPTKSNYSVCVESVDYDGSGKPRYKIRTEKTGDVCGNLGKDFEIFARSLQYGKGGAEVNYTLWDKLYSASLEEEVFNYLKDYYGTNSDEEVKCDPYCVIPVKISGPKQIVKFTNVDLLFRDGGLAVDEDSYKKFYELSIEPAKITTPKFLTIDLSKAKFSVPYDRKNKTSFALYLDNNLLFKDEIDIKTSFDFSISPRFALLGRLTKFSIVTEFNITSATWDFGDGSTEEGSGKSINHAYSDIGTYNLRVDIERKDGVTAVKNFDIIVGNPKEAGNKTLNDYRNRIANITKQVDRYSADIRAVLIEALELDEIKKAVDDIEKSYNNASSEEDYIKVIDELLALEIPYIVKNSIEEIFPLIAGIDDIDISYLEELSKEESEDEDAVVAGIAKWMNANYKATADYSVISSFTEDGREDLLSSYNLKITPISELKENAYLFIDYPFESIKFQKDYGQKSVGEGSGAYIPLDKNSQSIEFYIEESVTASELGAYISPELKGLSIVEDDDGKEICDPEEDEDCEKQFPLTNFLIWISVLFVITLIAYIILQEWYKRHYENHLFKNKQDLYNLVNFIYNSRMAGLHDDEIRKKLKASGWSGERINYAFKKIDGKRTGMWEIPIFKGFENRRVMEEIARRQGGAVNTKFIKRPSF